MPEAQRQFKHTKTKRTIEVYSIAKFQISQQTAPTCEPIKLKIKRWEKKTVDGGVLDVKEFFGGKWGELFQNNPARHNGTAHISSVLSKCKISGKILQ